MWMARRTPTVQTMSAALTAASLDDVAELLKTWPADSPTAEDLRKALAGSWQSVVVIVEKWDGLFEVVLGAARATSGSDVKLLLAHRHGQLNAIGELYREHLRHAIADVPFSPLLATYGAELGSRMEAVRLARLYLPGLPAFPAVAAQGPPELLPAGTDLDRFRRLAGLALSRREPPLRRLRTLYGLTTTQAAALFGVRRQAVEQWEITGIPTTRRAKLAAALEVGETLTRKLRLGLLPLVAQRPAQVFGGLSLLEMIRTDRHEELRRLTDQAFDWTTPA